MRCAREHRPCQILIVDDNDADIHLLERSFARLADPPAVRSVPDGAAALRLLRCEGEHAGTPLPDLVLLDLNLPGLGGHAVLAELKRDPELRRLPVIVLTTSNNPEDIRSCLDHHANAFVRKPFGLAGYRALADGIAAFWLRTAARAAD